MAEDSPPGAAHSFSGRTAWARNLQTPLRMFLRTETGSAAVLLAMAVAALAWVNIDASSYDGGLACAAVGPAQWRRGVAGPARVGEQRADDVLLLRLRPGGPPRVRHGRAAGAAAAGAAGRGRAGRAGGPGGHLPGRQRRPGGPRLGRGDVHRHGVRAGDAGPDRAPVPRPGPRVPAVGGGRRRPGLAGRHRRRLQQGARAGPAGCRGRDLRGDPGPAPGPDPVRHRLRAAGDRGVGRGPEVRHRPGRRRPGDGPADLRLPGGPDRPGTRQ